MLDGFLLLGAFVITLTGLGWLALAMNAHWKQVRKGLPSTETVLVLRMLSSTALLVSLMLCLSVDHTSMASLVWVMWLATAAMCIAFTLTLCPRLLTPLVVWARAQE